MKLHCPTCNGAVDIGDASRYSIFTCGCGRQFRGIHADECLADYLFWKFAGVPTRLLTFGLFGRLDQNKLNYTLCPFCDAEISISYRTEFKGVSGPENCWACTRKLPTEAVNNLIEWDGQKWVPKKSPAASPTVPPPASSVPPPIDPDAATKAQVHIDRAERLEDKEQWAAAITEYTAAIRLDPSSWLAYLKRGEAQQMVDDHARAIADLTKAIELNGSCAEAYRERACVYLIEDNFQQAIADSISAIRLTPNDAAAYRFKGCSHLRLNQHDDAIRDLSRSISLDQKDAGTFRSRGLAYWLTDANEQAIADFTRALALDPSNDFVAFCRGRAYFDADRMQEAIPDLERGTRLPLPDYDEAVQDARDRLAKARRRAKGK